MRARHPRQQLAHDVVRNGTTPAALAKDRFNRGTTPAGRSALSVLQGAAQQGDHRVPHRGSVHVDQVRVHDGEPVRADALQHPRRAQQIGVDTVQTVECLPLAQTIPPTSQTEPAQGCDHRDMVPGIGARLVGHVAIIDDPNPGGQQMRASLRRLNSHQRVWPNCGFRR